MATYEFAGAYDAAVLDTNSQLLKNTAFELVTEPGGVLATLYTNRTRSATVAQPFLSDAEGNVHLFTDPGRYRLRQAGSPPGEEVTVQPDPDETEGELEAHVVAADPHPVYLTAAEGNAAYDPAGAAAAGDAAHVATADPHPVYLTNGEHDARDHSVPAGTVVLFDLQDVGPAAPVGPTSLLAQDPGTLQWGPSPFISGTIPLGTAGSVMFYDPTGTTIAQDNPQLFWDNGENQMGIGTNVPTAKLHVVGGAAAAGLLLPGDPFLRVEDPSGGFAFIPSGTVVTIAHFNFSNAAFGSGTGGAIELGNLNRSSRIIHRSDVGSSVGSRLQLQAHAPSGSIWRPGITLWETGAVTVGADVDPASASAFVATLAVFAQAGLPLTVDISSDGFPAARPLRLLGDSAQTGALTEWAVTGVGTVFAIDFAGRFFFAASNESLTVGLAGGAAPLPATPSKYFIVRDSTGTLLQIPAYAA